MCDYAHLNTYAPTEYEENADMVAPREPPSVINEFNNDKYAVYCFTYVMGKLELKQRKFLFHVLEFIAMVSPTAVMIQLIYQYKKQFLMLPYRRIDQILLSLIRGSKYSIATALKMASLAGEFAELDLSAKDYFLKMKEKYEGISVELLKQIESHHLAAVLLETPSDIEGMTPLDLAFEYKLFSFLSQSKVEKIAHQVWIEQFFLTPKRTFEVSDIDAWNVLEFLKNPYRFYFQPFGKYVTQTFLFFAYLLMFSYILIQRPGIYDLPEPIEIIFWVFNMGYLGYEIYQALIEDGLKDYLTDWTNYVDMSISVNFAVQIVLRVVWIFSTASTQCDNYKLDQVEFNYNTGLAFADYQKCPTTSQISSTSGYWPSSCNQTFSDWPLPSNSTNVLCSTNATSPFGFDPSLAFYYSATFKCNCWKQLDHFLSDSCCRTSDSTEAMLFNFLYGFNAILLWTRTLYFFEQDSTLGPLIKIVMAMKDDFINYLKLTLLFMVGFSFAIRAFIGEYSFEFDTVQSTVLYMFKSTFGKIDFSVLEACGDSPGDLCNDNGWIPLWRSNLVQILIMGYLILALIMIRLLIAMISFTYNKMIRQAEYQVVYQYIKNAYELDRSSGLMPPPFNIFVFAIAVIWLIMDFLMVILINRYIDVENHLQLAKPVGNSYIQRVWHGWQDIFARHTTYWICSHCKHHNVGSYDISEYLAMFRPACDPIDAELVRVYDPVVCERCFRNKSSVGRMTIILQQISFVVFCVLVYPMLCVVVFIPALISWVADFLTDDANEGQWGDMDDDEEEKKKQFKRHQTMGGANSTKEDKAARKARKKREREARRKKELLRQAERYRMARQMSQLDTQLNTVSNTDSQATLAALTKSLKSIMKSHNPHTKHILTPNINELVDEVTSDKTPIARLQTQVKGIQTRMNEIYKLLLKMKRSGRSGGSNSDSIDSDDDGNDIKLSTLQSVHSHHMSKNHSSAMLNAMLSETNSSKSTNLNAPASDQSNKLSLVSNNSLRLAPTDSMRHRTSYKRKSQVKLDIGLANAVVEEEDQGNITDTENIVSAIVDEIEDETS